LTQDQLTLFWDLVADHVPLDEIARQLGVKRRFLSNAKFETLYEPKRPRE
jgi:hypothetical protein